LTHRRNRHNLEVTETGFGCVEGWLFVIARSGSDETIHVSACGATDCFRLRCSSYGGQVAAPRNDDFSAGLRQ
jgi:hypothetical protein